MKNNQPKQNYVQKHLPIDCSNDAMMVREGIRVPMLEQAKFERSSRSEIKEQIKIRTKALIKNADKHLTGLHELCAQFANQIESSKLNIVSFKIK